MRQRIIRVFVVAAAMVAAMAAWSFGEVGVMAPGVPAPAPTGKAFVTADYAAALKKFVNEDGRVDYAGLKRERAGLDRFVALLGVVGPKTKPEWFPTRADKLAYYLNAYNALTLFQVIERMPDFTSPYEEKVAFWGTTRFRVDGELTNLHSLENSAIRPVFQEPRVHFALNCASVGCPKLPREPFVGARLEAQLARETKRFLAEPRNVTVEKDALVLSEIFKWYGEDFPGGPETWIRERRPALPKTTQVSFRDYDWALNKQ